MPGGFPQGLELAGANDNGSVTASSIGTQCTGGATNTKGSYAQLIASTLADACWAIVTLDAGNGIGNAACVDIAVGGSGSEVVIAPNLVVVPSGSITVVQPNANYYSFPCQIPAGSRVAARCQGSSASEKVNVSVILFDGAFTMMEGAAGVDVYGFNTATTLGTQIDPGATINAKGAYVQLSASITNDIMGIFGAYDMRGSQAGALAAPTQFLIDIAIGGSGSEQIIVPNLPMMNERRGAGSAMNVCGVGNIPYIPLGIPAGTRVAARAQCNSADATARLFGLTLYGVRR